MIYTILVYHYIVTSCQLVSRSDYHVLFCIMHYSSHLLSRARFHREYQPLGRWRGRDWDARRAVPMRCQFACCCFEREVIEKRTSGRCGECKPPEPETGWQPWMWQREHLRQMQPRSAKEWE